MILTNLALQLITMIGNYRKKGFTEKLKEAFVTILFMRPIVDAYRVATNHEDDKVNITRLSELMVNKGLELFTEGIPGCVLQLFVWLSSPEDAGSYALVSIAISALTTGYTSAIMAFVLDVDLDRRKNQPKFYGYVLDDHGSRRRTFALMTMISALHNLSRSVGLVLLVASSGGKTLAVIFTVGEVLLYLAYKLTRQDFFWFPEFEGPVGFSIHLIQRVAVKVIADFTGCIHFRHP